MRESEKNAPQATGAQGKGHTEVRSATHERGYPLQRIESSAGASPGRCLAYTAKNFREAPHYRKASRY